MKKEIIGVDVSKLTLDVCLHDAKQHKRFKNDEEGFEKLFLWILKETGLPDEDIAFCFEHTGLYSMPLSFFLHQRQICFYFVSGLMVKRSLGLVRGKNDKVDAKHLAHFAYIHREELQPYQMPSETIIKLKQINSFRTRLVKQCGGYKAHVREMRQVLGTSDQDVVMATSLEMITILEEKIKAMEKRMLELIQLDEKVLGTYKNITSIKGVGLILATAMVVSTNNFQSFKTWRQFACYAGIAPFDHQSGTSYRGKTRISSLGNRELKTLLSQSAASAIQCNAEMKLYYQRRLSEGKNKMSTLNIIRNKIVSRIFAVARRESAYVNTAKFAA
jgi:transposase